MERFGPALRDLAAKLELPRRARPVANPWTISLDMGVMRHKLCHNTTMYP